MLARWVYCLQTRAKKKHNANQCLRRRALVLVTKRTNSSPHLWRPMCCCRVLCVLGTCRVLFLGTCRAVAAEHQRACAEGHGAHLAYEVEPPARSARVPHAGAQARMEPHPGWGNRGGGTFIWNRERQCAQVTRGGREWSVLRHRFALGNTHCLLFGHVNHGCAADGNPRFVPVVQKKRSMCVCVGYTCL